MNALKTVSLRIRSATSELEDMGEETDDVLESTAKYQETIKNLTAVNGKDGVDIVGDDGNLKSTYEILLDIADVYEEIGKAEGGSLKQAELLETLGGKRNASVVSSVLLNEELLKQAYEESKNSLGATSDAYETYTDSIQSALNTLTATFQEFSTDVLNTELVKNVVKLASGFLGVTDNVVKLTGGLPALISGFIVWRELTKKKDEEYLGKSFLGLVKSLISYNGQLDLTIAKEAIAAAGTIALEAALTLGLGVAITFITQKMSELNVTMEEYVEMSKDAAQAAEDSKEKQEELKEQIDKLNEAKSDTSLTVDQEKSLETQISLLERQLELEKKITKEKKTQATENAINALNSKSVTISETVETASGKQQTVNTSMTSLEAEEYYANKYKETLEKYNSETNEALKDGYGDLLEEYASKMLEYYQDVIDGTEAAADNGNAVVDAARNTAAELASIVFQLDTDSVESDLEQVGKTAADVASDIEKLNTAIDSVQSAYKTLNDAVAEQNNYGALSIDSLQALLSLDNEYLASLDMQNGKLAVNMDYLDQVTQKKLEEAKANATNQLITDLNAVATETEAEASVAAGNSAVAEATAMSTLTGIMGDTASAAIGLAQAQEVLAAYQTAYSKNSEKTKTIVEAYQERIKLINSVSSYAASGTRQLSNALNGFSDSAKDAKNAADALKDSLEAQKKVLEQQKDDLEDQSKELKAYGEAVVKNLEAQIDKLNEQKDAQDKAYESQIESLNDKKDALEKANDEEDRAIKLAELEEALAKAKASKTARVYQDGQGYTWQANQSDVDEAQKNLEDQVREYNRDDQIQAIEDEIDAINDLKDAYDESIEAQIDDIEKVKDTWSDTVSLVGSSWEEYQMMLQATAETQGMTLEEIAAKHTEYKDAVVANMQQIYDIESQLTEVENQLTEATNAANEAGSAQNVGLTTTSGNVQSTTEKIAEYRAEIERLGAVNDELKQKEQELTDELNRGVGTAKEYDSIQQQLTFTKAEDAANTQLMSEVLGQYADAVVNASDLSIGEKQMEIDKINELDATYSIAGADVSGVIQTYASDLIASGDVAEEEYANATTIISQFATSAVGHLNNVREAAIRALEAINMAKSANGGSIDGNASGSRYIYKNEPSTVDEYGGEIVVRNRPGRFTTLEVGDGVVPHSLTDTLFDAALNPTAFIKQAIEKHFGNMSALSGASNSTVVSVGDIVVQGVQDVDGFARAIESNIGNIMRQAVTKRA